MPGVPHALRFGTATSDRVLHSVLAGVNRTNYSLIGYFKPTTLTANRRLATRFDAVTAGQGWLVSLSGTAGNVIAQWQGVSNMNTVTSDTPLATLNQWYVVLATQDQTAAAGSRGHIYVSKNGGPLIESALGTNADGATFGSIATVPYATGNTSGASPIQALQGNIGPVSLFEGAAVLTIQQGEEWIRDWRADYRGWGEQLKVSNGANGRGAVIDLSGNGYHGALSGAIPVSDYIPRISPRRRAA